MFPRRPRIPSRHGLRRRFDPVRAGSLFCVASFITCLATGSRAQWIEAGPYTSTSTIPNTNAAGLINSNTLTSGMPAQGDPVYGAINTVLESPTSPSTYWAGTVGGGIWMTTNGGVTWKPTSDNQLSLAIGALALDSADSSGQTVYAGTGQYSNYSYPFVPVAAPAAPGVPVLTGLLKSTNGGASWSSIASTGLAIYYLNGGTPTIAANGLPNIDGVIASGNNLLVAAYSPYPCCETPTSGGLFRSTDGGATFTLVTGFGTAVTSLISTTVNGQNVDFVARVSEQHSFSNGVLYSSDSGATWTPILNSLSTIANGGLAFGTNYESVKVAAGAGGSLFVAVANTSGDITRLYYTPNFTPGQTPVWYDLGQPKITDQGQTRTLEGAGLKQAATNFVLTADPNQKGVAYISGSGYSAPEAAVEVAAIFRVNVDTSNAATYTSLIGNGSSPSASPHSDSRSLYINAAGQLVTSDDGGIYIASSPQSTPTWSAFGGVAANGSPIRVLEAYQAVIDPATGRIAVATQDNGVALSQSSLTAPWQSIADADGFSVGINAKTNGPSIFYGTHDGVFMSRVLANTQLSASNPPTLLELDVGTVGQTYVDYEGSAASQTIVLAVNQEDPTKLAFRSTRLYTWQDPQNLSPNTTNILLTDITNGSPLFSPAAWAESIAYGTKDAPDAILAGGPLASNISVAGYTNSSGVFLRTQAQADANQPVGSGNLVTSYTGFDPVNVLFDPRTEQRFFIADSINVYGTQDLGAHMTALTLPSNFATPNGLAYILANGVDALVVGGTNTTTPSGNVVATQDPFDGASTVWQTLQSGIPNTVVQGLTYNASIDTLLAATLGRGVFLLYDVTSNFANANVLQFGLANNDSNPDASILTDGTVGSRPLIKYGTGTLTIAGNATYSGTTTVNGGILDVEGALSNTSSVAVNSTGILSGGGTVDPLVVAINTGGTFAPGTPGLPGTSMAIVGNLAFQSGTFYLVQLNAATSTFATVSGTASLGGSAVAMFAAGTNSPAHQYTILQSAGLNGTTFDGVATQNLPNFNANLSYTADDVFLNMTAALGASAGLNGNQQNVANGLNNFYNSGGTLPANFASVFGLSGPSLANTLSALSGEAAADAEHGSINMMNQFLDLMLDPTAGGGGSTSGGDATGFAPEQDASLPTDIARAYAKALRAPRPQAPQSFDQRWTAWGSSFGGASFTNGNAAIGSNNVTASDYGFAAGMDYLATPNVTYGFGLTGGGTNWTLAQGLGSGRSDAFQAGVYAKAHAGPAYLSAALAFANHWFTTNRTALGDQLRGNFTGQSYAARLEGGYRYAVPITGAIVGVTPYAALQAQDFHTPSYTETDLTGGGFGLSYASMNATDTRSELGARFDNLQVVYGMPLVLRGRLAWAHDWVTNPSLGAVFQTLPGSNFVVNGVAPPKNSALTTAGAELHVSANWTAIARFDGEFGSGSQTYGGSGTLRYSW